MQEKQLLDRLNKAEQRIVDLYAKLQKLKVGTYSREIITLPIPEEDDYVNVSISALDTIILFEGNLVDDFNLNVSPGPDTVQGDRIYLMVKGANTVDIQCGDKLSPIQCGDDDTVINVETYMICHEMVYDGTQFTGIDNC